MYTMNESVAVAKEADAKKGVSPTRSDKSIQRLRNVPEMQLGSLRDVIGNIRHDGGTPSVESIATQLSGMHSAERAPALLALQQTHGNRYVQRVVAGIQAKLVVGQPGDKYEQEADRVAEQVMRMSESQMQRQVEEEEEQIQTKPLADKFTPLVQRRVEEEEEELLQTKAHSSQVTEVTSNIESRIQSLKGGGQPLSEPTRSFFEPRFGQDFSQVRVHTDTRAAESARNLGARAYTVDTAIVFGAGQYAPANTEGRRLLAHELTHVVQQADRTMLSPLPDKSVAGYSQVNENEEEVARKDLANVCIPPHRAPSVLQKSHQPFIMRTLLFSSTMEICRRLLESRVFHVSQGGIRVTANAAYERRGRPECSSADYHMTLNQKGLILDSGYGTCEFPQGQIFSRQWKNLPAGNYNLTIWTNNTNPYCCLVGDIIVDQQSGLQGDSCTQPPPGPLQAMHLALDLAGLIPGVGVVADGANLIIYAAEGDWSNAGISAAALVPVIGGAAVVMRRGRQVVRVSGEVVEQMGRSRMTSALRRARGSRGAAGVAEETGEGVTRRMFAQRNPTIADPSLPPGTGHTDRFGNMAISSAGSATDQALVRYHEQVHSFLSPRLNFLRNFRANLRISAYQRSAFLQYLEEALAETYAQLRVHGIRNLPNGIRFPIREGYVTLRAVVTEAAIGTVLFGGLTYGVYIWASQESAPETP